MDMINTEYRKFLEDSLPLLKKKKLPFWHRTRHTKHDTLRYCLKKFKEISTGLIAEFGVYKGTTIRMIANANPSARIFGFDSFTGFPEDGRNDWKQSFSLEGELPSVPNNVTLIKGYFEETLPPFIVEHTGELFSFLHIDCDIYSSTKTIFNNCKSMIGPGCIIVFDELLHYPRFLENEMLAFYEFIQETGLNFEWLAIRGKVLTIDEFLNPSSNTSLFVNKRMKFYREQGYEQEVALRIID